MVRRRGKPRQKRDARRRIIGALNDNQWCPRCGKWIYATAKAAERAARVAHRDDGLVPYPCPAGHGHHYGHIGQSG